jgi:hypothetical protein
VHAAYARIESGQWTIKGWHTAAISLLLPALWAHHAIDTRVAEAVRCQITYCPIEAVKLTYSLNPPNQRNRFYIMSSPVWKIVAFKQAILNFFKQMANVSLDQN